MSQSQQMSILVIDDDAMNREVMEAFLSSEDYTVILATNGEQGIALATERFPDAIIVDVRMPGISGYQVCEHLRSQSSTQHIPIMMISGFDAVEDSEYGRSVGANDFLARPFNGVEMLERLKALLDAR